MMIIQTVNFSDFCDAFRACGRNENFSYQGKRVLFDMLEDISGDTDVPYELDVVALCCEFCELSLDEFIDYYRIDVSDCDDEDARRECAIEYLEMNAGWVQWLDNNRVIFQEF